MKITSKRTGKEISMDRLPRKVQTEILYQGLKRLFAKRKQARKRKGRN